MGYEPLGSGSMLCYEIGWEKIGMYASMAGKDEASHNRSNTIGERCCWGKKRLMNHWHIALSII
jgi:hypothetical protein